MFDLKVKQYGWAIVQVEDGDRTFSYTMGLVENFGHPELIVLDYDIGQQQPLLNEIAQSIAANGRPVLNRPSTLGMRCVEVHKNQLNGDYFGTWAYRYGRLPQPGQVLQVVIPNGMYCECHQHTVRRLDRPYSTPPVQLNRAQRRRRRPGPHSNRIPLACQSLPA